MHLRSLKIFCDVVRQRSFSRAADQNDMSQSGASQLVHQLEERLGVKLIDRSKRPFMLTPEGRLYYEGCRGLVERYFSLEDKVRTLHREVAGRVCVAAIYSVGLHHMNRSIQLFMGHHPKANVRLEYLHPDRVYKAVESDAADLGLVSYARSSRNIQADPWRTEPMVLVCAPGHRLAGQRQIALADLDGEGFIGFDDNLTIRREIDRVLHQHQLDVRYAMEFDNIETIKRAIEINAGVGLLPEPTVVSEVESGRLIAVPLACNELVRPLGIICRRGKELSATAKLFIEHLHKEGTEVDSPADTDFSPESSVDDSNGQDAAVTASAGQGSNGHTAAKGASGDA